MKGISLNRWLPSLWAACLVCFLPLTARADDAVLDLSLEELMKIEVTGLSKKEDTFSKLPAAAYVITEQDIRSSTATALPELLKLVPGINVSQINSGRYAVSARGFNSLFSNKLLILIDGKDAYSSLFSSINWDAVDIPFEDIKRIEVYRGAAGTIYGSNAVNGIINIITKSAGESVGSYVGTKVGDLERVAVDLRNGGEISEDFDYRISGKFRNQEILDTPFDSGSTDTGYESYHMALRVDGELSSDTTTSTHARYATSRIRDTSVSPSLTSPIGFDVAADMSRQHEFYIMQEITHQVDEDLTTVGQIYFNREDREAIDLSTVLNTISAEGRVIYNMADNLDFVGGGTYRYIDTDLNDAEIIPVAFADDDPSFTVAGLFGQFDYVPTDKWKLYAGMRAEYNEYTDVEWMPNLRVAYFPKENHTLWGSVGRATRLPAIGDENGVAERFTGQFDPNTGLPLVVNFDGSSGSEAETSVAYELGYRGSVSSSVTLDISTFFYDFSDLQTVISSGMPGINPGPPPAIVAPAQFAYQGDGEVWGVETGIRYAYDENYFVYASHSYLDFSLSGLGDLGGIFEEGADPANKVTFQFHASPTDDVHFDLFYYFVDSLQAFENVEPYHQFDAKLRYDISQDVSLSIIGRNLFEDDHFEWGQDEAFNIVGGEVPRSFYGMIEVKLN